MKNVMLLSLRLVSALVVVGMLLAAPFAHAQPAKKLLRIGILSPFSSSVDAFRDAYRERLQELGYSSGRNITLEYRAAEGMADRLPQLALDLVKMQVDAIVTTTAPGAQAAKQATATIPIIVAGVDDAVDQGFVTSLARPGGNITGISWLDTGLSAKRVELLKQTVTKTSRIAFLREAVGAASSLRAIEASARTLGIRLVVVELRGPNEIDSVFSALAHERVDGVVVAQSPMITGQERQIVELAMKHRMATIFPFRKAVEAGALMSYGPKSAELYRRAADYTDRILKGAKPSELPVEQPTSFELVINLRTADALGMKIPQAILVSADEVIR
ncbi:MAG: ABC transporter substrate-binding protein [Betaproteobacteria bacterium]|nr:ABC transporter substrate-binding protein [Betaproteobacteria bacterium]